MRTENKTENEKNKNKNRMHAQKKQQQSMIWKFWDFYNNKIIINYRKGTTFQIKMTFISTVSNCSCCSHINRAESRMYALINNVSIAISICFDEMKRIQYSRIHWTHLCFVFIDFNCKVAELK